MDKDLNTSQLTMEAIGTLHCPYKQKFGIPRQPGLVKSVTATIELHDGYNSPDMVRGLSECSHLWLIFIFSENVSQGWKPLVRPPRLGGNKKLGVLATRSPFRPNPIGLSAVKLNKVLQHRGKVTIEVEGADLMDGTPIVDIKPYIPYSDQLQDASYPMTDPAIVLGFPVVFSESTLDFCRCYQQTEGIDLQQQIEDILQHDPRPAYKKDLEARQYVINIHNLDILWRITASTIFVDRIVVID